MRKGSPGITREQMASFLKGGMFDTECDSDQLSKIMSRYGNEHDQVLFHGFVAFLSSGRNNIIKPVHRTVFQDLTQPLSDYFINSRSVPPPSPPLHHPPTHAVADVGLPSNHCPGA